MRLIYRSNVEGEEDVKNVNDIGYSLETVIKLMGLHAIHDVADVIETATIVVEKELDIIVVFILTQVVAARIHIRPDKTIYYDYLRVFKEFQGNRYGIAVFYTAIEAAQREKFEHVRFLAFGDRTLLNHPEELKGFNGYATWTDAQIEMEEDSLANYQMLLTRAGIPFMPLHELIMQEEVKVRSAEGEIIVVMSGKDFWLRYGSSWDARINLSTYIPANAPKCEHKIIKVHQKSKENTPE